MAFWGIGKLKEYGGMINLKDVGSKIKTYVVSALSFRTSPIKKTKWRKRQLRTVPLTNF